MSASPVHSSISRSDLGNSTHRHTASGSATSSPSALDALRSGNSPQESLTIDSLQRQLQSQAQQDPAGFRAALQAAFGGKASPAQLDQLLDMAMAGKLPMPANVEFVDAGALGENAMGAYSAENGGTIYLDRRLLSNPGELQAVFNEELGHSLDTQLGGAEAAGDEGAIFAQTLANGPVSADELAELRAENDNGVVWLDGRSLRVEFSMDEAAAGQDDTEATSNSDDGGSTGEPSGSGDNGDSGGGGGDEDNSTPSNANDNTADGPGGGDPDQSAGMTAPANDPDPDDHNEDHHDSDDNQNDSPPSPGDNPGGDNPDTPDLGGSPPDDSDDDRDNQEESDPVDTDVPADEPEPEQKSGWFSRALDGFQVGLDFAGFIPGLGAIPDLANAGIHAVRGNKSEAALSLAAAVPVFGDAAKGAVMGARAVDRTLDATRGADRLNDARRAGDDALPDGMFRDSSGRVRNADGTFASDPARVAGDLNRPYIRSQTRQTVEDRAPRTADGRFVDPNTGKPIDGPYDLGHKPGHEFRRERARADAEGLTQSEFNDRMNDPDLYQIEDPSSNRSHQFELPGND